MSNRNSIQIIQDSSRSEWSQWVLSNMTDQSYKICRKLSDEELWDLYQSAKLTVSPYNQIQIIKK